MFSDFEYSGIWYVPGLEKVTFHGVLNYQANDFPRLKCVSDSQSYKNSLKNDIPVLLGKAVDGQEITLINCINENYQINSANGISGYEYIVLGYIIIGKHFVKSVDIVFNRIYAKYNLLEDWLDINNIEHEYTKDVSRITLKKSDSIQFDIDDDTKGEFGVNWDTSFSKASKVDVKVMKSAYFQMVSSDKSNTHIDSLIEQLLHFQRFMTLVTGTKIYPKKIGINIDLGNEVKQLEIMYPLEFDKTTPIRKLSTKLPFKYSTLQYNFKNLIQAWFQNKNKYESVLNLLFEVIYNDQVFNENSFLNVIQALETFHRRTHKNQVLNKEEHKKKIKEIIEKVDEEHRDWLKGKLQFSNEPSLHERLQELIAEYGTENFKTLVADENEFIKKIKWSRNYYTHYDSRNKKKALKGSNLFYLNQKVLILLKICLLKIVGFDTNQINHFIKKDNNFRILKLRGK